MMSTTEVRTKIARSILAALPLDMAAAPGLWCAVYDGAEETDLLPAWISWGSMGVIDYEMNPR